MKLGQYVVMLLVLIMVMEFMGLPTGLGSILNLFGVSINSHTHELISADIGNSSFFDKLFLSGTGILAVLLTTAGAVIVGLFSKSYDPSLIILPIIIFTATTFISLFWSTIKYIQIIGEPWLTALVSTVFVGLAGGFIWSCMDYFAGR